MHHIYVLVLLVAAMCGGTLSYGEAQPATLTDHLVPLKASIETDWLERDGDCSLAKTREILERGLQLAIRIRSIPGHDHCAIQTLERQLTEMGQKLETVELAGAGSAKGERELWLDAHSLVRRITFLNPVLLQIRRLLFITRHDPGGVFHMVDQFYGFNAKPGGRLYVLMNPFGEEPRLIDLLRDVTVANGRLQGRKLENGAFLSPEVSFDGQEILFAWTEAKGKDLEWSSSASYHIFKLELPDRARGHDMSHDETLTGGTLVQLTDGSWNDFDPCYLPNGRIAFVSERRGGYLRCGRHCPTYTLHAMGSDGSDIVCLSFHETHEWHPSITHDGRIIFTRWDYVDRDTNIAHHPWTCRPDGADPRAVHGNYPVRRESRPWMEMDIRAIPGSHRYVATAAAHHGHAFGSLVIIDPEIPDDGASAQLTRLTPDVPFPESEKHLLPVEQNMAYGTPWPLSEDDFLCVYDAKGKNRGIYWIDRFGNRELIYRDPAISSLSPMPLEARARPPVIPSATGAATGEPEQEQSARSAATVALMNVYDSDFSWPPGAAITALRVIQLLPKSTPAPNQPRIGVAEQTNARAVLGSVPVEPDGSAYFEAPAGKPIYFQALDADGQAVQSMRSVTYLQPGEQLTCQGCHEPRQRAPYRGTAVPLALRRAPSKIRPELDGSNPFSFVRLVQPVLNAKCVDCHRATHALDLSDVIEGKEGWTRSYASLAARYGFYFHVFNGAIHTGVHGGSRSIAGQFGAAASPLLPYLDARHYEVQLSPEERRRLLLWLDCNSEFYGSYEQTDAQARGAIVTPTLE